MGGVEATARLLREGGIVPEGPMGGRFVLMGLNDDEIENGASSLHVRCDRRELRPIFRDPELNEGTGLNGSFGGPMPVERMPCRHCATRG
jgi:hypothetical protein